MSFLPSEADITAIYKPGKDNFFFFMNTHCTLLPCLTL